LSPFPEQLSLAVMATMDNDNSFSQSANSDFLPQLSTIVKLQQKEVQNNIQEASTPGSIVKKMDEVKRQFEQLASQVKS
jgi:hypothetical protein